MWWGLYPKRQSWWSIRFNADPGWKWLQVERVTLMASHGSYLTSWKLLRVSAQSFSGPTPTSPCKNLRVIESDMKFLNVVNWHLFPPELSAGRQKGHSSGVKYLFIYLYIFQSCELCLSLTRGNGWRGPLKASIDRNYEQGQQSPKMGQGHQNTQTNVKGLVKGEKGLDFLWGKLRFSKAAPLHTILQKNYVKYHHKPSLFSLSAT